VFTTGSNDCLAVIKDLKPVLEERRLDWNKIFELGQRDGLLHQLPVGVAREMTEDQLVWVGHEVVLVQLIANMLRRQLTRN